jgi:hypothetical protein
MAFRDTIGPFAAQSARCRRGPIDSFAHPQTLPPLARRHRAVHGTAGRDHRQHRHSQHCRQSGRYTAEPQIGRHQLYPGSCRRYSTQWLDGRSFRYAARVFYRNFDFHLCVRVVRLVGRCADDDGCAPAARVGRRDDDPDRASVARTDVPQERVAGPDNRRADRALDHLACHFLRQCAGGPDRAVLCLAAYARLPCGAAAPARRGRSAAVQQRHGVVVVGAGSVWRAHARRRYGRSAVLAGAGFARRLCLACMPHEVSCA